MMFDNDEKAAPDEAFDNRLTGTPTAGGRMQEVLPPLAMAIVFVMIALGLHGADTVVLVIAGALLAAVVATFVVVRAGGGGAR